MLRFLAFEGDTFGHSGARRWGSGSYGNCRSHTHAQGSGNGNGSSGQVYQQPLSLSDLGQQTAPPAAFVTAAKKRGGVAPSSPTDVFGSEGGELRSKGCDVEGDDGDDATAAANSAVEGALAHRRGRRLLTGGAKGCGKGVQRGGGVGDGYEGSGEEDAPSGSSSDCEDEAPPPPQLIRATRHAAPSVSSPSSSALSSLPPPAPPSLAALSFDAYWAFLFSYLVWSSRGHQSVAFARSVPVDYAVAAVRCVLGPLMPAFASALCDFLSVAGGLGACGGQRQGAGTDGVWSSATEGFSRRALHPSTSSSISSQHDHHQQYAASISNAPPSRCRCAASHHPIVPSPVRQVNFDLWTSIVHFGQVMEYPLLAHYDPADSWPVLLDEFVQWSVPLRGAAAARCVCKPPPPPSSLALASGGGFVGAATAAGAASLPAEPRGPLFRY